MPAERGAEGDLSAWPPPVTVSDVEIVSVLCRSEDGVRVSVPAPRLMVPVSAVASVTVSAPVPPVIVSTLETVTVLVPVARVSVSVPAPRSMVPPAMRRADRDRVDRQPPVTVSTLETVSVLAPADDSDQAVGAGAEVDGARGLGGASVTASSPRAAGDGLDVGHGEGVGAAGGSGCRRCRRRGRSMPGRRRRA